MREGGIIYRLEVRIEDSKVDRTEGRRRERGEVRRIGFCAHHYAGVLSPFDSCGRVALSSEVWFQGHWLCRSPAQPAGGGGRSPCWPQ